MSDIDATRLSDYTLAETYFDLVNDTGADTDLVEVMKNEMEERDLLFEGYRIHDWTSGFRVRHCPFSFKRLEDLKDYILGHCGIEPTEDGSMYYIGCSSEELRLKPEDCKLSEGVDKKLTEIVNKW
jgi:hypothetical protein